MRPTIAAGLLVLAAATAAIGGFGAAQGPGIQADSAGSQKVTVSNVSAFGEVLAVSPTPVVQATYLYGADSRVWTVTPTGTGTLTVTDGQALLSTGTTPGSTIQSATKRTLRYRPGQGAVVKFTGYFTSHDGGTLALGAFDASDGFGFGFHPDSTELALFYRARGATTWVNKSDWNGTPVTVTTSFGQVYAVQYQWLGFGRLNWIMEKPGSKGEMVVVHTLDYAGTSALTSVQNPSFPIVAYAESATTTASTVGMVCGTGFVEGVVRYLGPTNATEFSETGIGTTEEAVLSIRNPSTVGGETNRSDLVFTRLSGAAFSTTSRPLIFRAWLDATVGGTASFSTVGSGIAESATDVTTVSGGVLLATQTAVANSGSAVWTPNMGDFVLPPGSTVTFTAEATTATTVEPTITATWIEDL